MTTTNQDQLASDFLMINSGTYFSEPSALEEQKEPDTSIIDMYDLPQYDLSAHKIVVIDSYVDQELMLKQKEQISDFLSQGNLLLFSGNLFRPWLPGASSFVPKKITKHSDYNVMIAKPHPVLEGVEPDDLTYNKGVSGFFARGHHPLPPQAEVLLTLADGEPITYIDRHSTNGTIVVHSGTNLLRYTNRNNTSGRIREQLKRWMLEEHAQIALRGAVR